MPQPVLSDVHVNRPLTIMSFALLQEEKDFAAMQVFPGVPSDNKSDLFFKFDQSYFFRNSMKKRAPATPAAAGAYGVSTDTFVCDEWALMYPVADQIRRNTDMPLNPDRNAVQYLTQQALQNREGSWATTFFTTGIWTNNEKAGHATLSDSTHVVYWDKDGSKPVEDVLTARLAIKQKTGVWPNVLVLGAHTHKSLLTNAEVIDRLKYGQTAPGIVTVDDSDLARLFRVEKVVVSSAIQTTSNEGAATATYDFIAGKHALLAYAAPSPGIEVPSAGYCFNWKGLTGATAAGMRIKRYRWEKTASDDTEIESAYVFKLVSTDLGYFFYNVVQ